MVSVWGLCLVLALVASSSGGGVCSIDGGSCMRGAYLGPWRLAWGLALVTFRNVRVFYPLSFRQY